MPPWDDSRVLKVCVNRGHSQGPGANIELPQVGLVGRRHIPVAGQDGLFYRGCVILPGHVQCDLILRSLRESQREIQRSITLDRYYLKCSKMFF